MRHARALAGILVAVTVAWADKTAQAQDAGSDRIAEAFRALRGLPDDPARTSAVLRKAAERRRVGFGVLHALPDDPARTAAAAARADERREGGKDRVSAAFIDSTFLSADAQRQAAAFAKANSLRLSTRCDEMFGSIDCLWSGLPPGRPRTIQSTSIEPGGPEIQQCVSLLDGWWEGESDILALDCVRDQGNVDLEKPFQWSRFLVKRMEEDEAVFTVGADLYEADIASGSMKLRSSRFRGERELTRR